MPDDPDLLTIIIHADAALRRKRDALDALDNRKPDHEGIPLEFSVGEATQGAVSLFLALDAASRFCSRYPTPGPFWPKQKAAFLKSATHLRDAVMHWDDKGHRSADNQHRSSTERASLSSRRPLGSSTSVVEWRGRHCAMHHAIACRCSPAMPASRCTRGLPTTRYGPSCATLACRASPSTPCGDRR